MTRIFISYRRADSEGYVGRLYDQLVTYYDRSEVFLDVAAITPGADFSDAIDAAIASCTALLAVIGPQWLTVSGSHGRRLDDPDDFVRREIAAALRHNLLVIPVLIQRAEMPAARDLPDPLKPLARCNAIEISHDRFAFDVERLVSALGGAHGTVVVMGPMDSASKILGLTVTMGLFPLKVMIDRRTAATLTEKGTTAIQAEAGTHTLQLISGSWQRTQSNTLSFDLKGGQRRVVSFGTRYSSAPGGRSQLVVTLGTWDITGQP